LRKGKHQYLGQLQQENCALERKIYAQELGIDLASKQEKEYFKWFLACLLFGKPIQQEVAKRTYAEFVKEGLTTPDAIIEAGWDKLVEVLDRGHYVRYDFSTATKLLDASKALKEPYGTLTDLLKQSQTIDELSSRLQKFKGIGPKTAEIFLRDITPIFLECHR
jgi:endonuclease III